MGAQKSKIKQASGSHIAEQKQVQNKFSKEKLLDSELVAIRKEFEGMLRADADSLSEALSFLLKKYADNRKNRLISGGIIEMIDGYVQAPDLRLLAQGGKYALLAELYLHGLGPKYTVDDNKTRVVLTEQMMVSEAVQSALEDGKATPQEIREFIRGNRQLSPRTIGECSVVLEAFGENMSLLSDAGKEDGYDFD